jgi:hypothetical protein
MVSLRKTIGTMLAMQVIQKRFMMLTSMRGLMMGPHITSMGLVVEKV